MTDTGSAVGASAPPISPTMSSTPTGTGQLQGSGMSNNGSGALTFDQVENYWISAGGNPQAAAMAAAVADAESGLNPNAQRTNPDGTIGIGLWLLPQNGTPPGSTDPLASARAALQLSQNGTDWTQWCSSWSDNNCGCNGGTYLGSGSNALMSLQTQYEPGSYNVIGSTPSGSGTGASTSTSTSSGSGSTSSSSSKVLLIGGIILVILAVVFISRRKMDQQAPEGQEGEPTPE
jgi:Lysozyme like domain